jgi:hypothetical protein
MQMEPLDPRRRPTMADVVTRLSQLHGCVEDGKAQTTEVNGKVDTLTATVNRVEGMVTVLTGLAGRPDALQLSRDHSADEIRRSVKPAALFRMRTWATIAALFTGVGTLIAAIGAFAGHVAAALSHIH